MVLIESLDCHVETPFPTIHDMEKAVKEDFGGEIPDIEEYGFDRFYSYYEKKMIQMRGGSGVKLMGGRIRSVYIVYRILWFRVKILKHRYWMPYNRGYVPNYIDTPVLMN